MTSFYERFRELRDERGMNQKEFATFLGIPRASVGFYEAGSRMPDANNIERICRKCGVSADWLLGLGGVKSDNPNIAAIGKITGLSPKTVELLWRQKKAIDLAELDAKRFALPSLADFVNFAIEHFPNNFAQAHQNMTEAIVDYAFIRDDLQERLNDFLNDAEIAPVLDFIRIKLGGDIISADLKKEMCIEVAVKMYRLIIENYIGKRGSELESLLDKIRDKEGENADAVDTKEND